MQNTGVSVMTKFVVPPIFDQLLVPVVTSSTQTPSKYHSINILHHVVNILHHVVRWMFNVSLEVVTRCTVWDYGTSLGTRRLGLGQEEEEEDRV